MNPVDAKYGTKLQPHLPSPNCRTVQPAPAVKGLDSAGETLVIREASVDAARDQAGIAILEASGVELTRWSGKPGAIQGEGVVLR